MLSFSRSFRGTNLDRIIQAGQKFLKISSKIYYNSINVSICIEKSLKSNKITSIDGNKASTKDCLLKLPVISLCFGSENLFNTTSDNRRSFIDAGLFHVKHEYMPKLQSYNKLLFSRNKSLKSGDTTDIGYWTDRLIDYALVVHEYRTRYMDELISSFAATIEELSSHNDLYADISSTTINYNSGYSGDSLVRQYDLCLSKDKALGFTTIGPHRADIDFRIDDIALKDVASMSTQVILSLCLVIAQTRTFHVKHNHYPVLLIDDIFFGIDDKNLEVMIKLLSNSGAQCFLTAPDLYTEKVKQVIGKSDSKLFTLIDKKVKGTL